MFTQQETFDMACSAMIQQWRPCFKYRDGDIDNLTFQMPRYKLNNLCCPVGSLIPPELYHPHFEGRRVNNNLISDVLSKLGHSVTLCSLLQPCHDDWFGTIQDIPFMPYFIERARKVAKLLGLDPSVLDRKSK